uniref:Putative secreted protein n=1 Tax=Anopheles darlingi TaxID=43151 RepID=A0A2M4D256_ANODA
MTGRTARTVLLFACSLLAFYRLSPRRARRSNLRCLRDLMHQSHVLAHGTMGLIHSITQLARELLGLWTLFRWGDFHLCLRDFMHQSPVFAHGTLGLIDVIAQCAQCA